MFIKSLERLAIVFYTAISLSSVSNKESQLEREIAVKSPADDTYMPLMRPRPPMPGGHWRH